MNSRNLLQLAVCAGSFAAAVLVASCSQQPDLNEAVLAKLQSAQVPNRIFAGELTPIEFASDPSAHLYGPLSIKASDSGIFVVDYAEQLLKRFDHDGEFLGSIGNGRGSGPGEFGNMVDFAIGEDHVWIADHQQRRITKFRFDGTYVEERTAGEGPVVRVADLSADDPLILTYRPDGIFVQVSPDDSVKVFGKLVSEKISNPITLMGRIEALEPGGFAFSLSQSSYLFFFNADFDLYSVVVTPDGQELQAPTTEESSGRIILRSPSPDAVVGSVGTYGDSVFIFTRNKTDEESHYLDVYEVSTGQYERSYRVPRSVTTLDVVGDVVFAALDTTIVKYEMEHP